MSDSPYETLMTPDQELYNYLRTTLEINPEAPLLTRAWEYAIDNNLDLKRKVEAICFDVILDWGNKNE